MKISLAFCFFGSALMFSQQENCNLKKSEFIGIPTVDKNDIQCIAKNSGKPNTVFYTLASWCQPCIEHLPDALQLENDFKTQVYVILVEPEDDMKVRKAMSIITKRSAQAKMLVLKNTVYEGGVKKRNKTFAKQITPPNFETVSDFSKFIVVNNQGEVKMVTNWRDYKKLDNKNRENVQEMLSHTVIPLLK